MTTASEIITKAFRQENLIAVGTTPTSEEETEALELLNDLVREIIGDELGELVYDWQVPKVNSPSPIQRENPDDPYGRRENTLITNNPDSNSRLVTTLSSDLTIYFPQYPDDGARMNLTDIGSSSVTLTINGNGYFIEGNATLDLDPSTLTDEVEWFFRADLGQWVRLQDLTSGSEQPFPRRFDSMLYTGLAILLAPRYGKEPKNVTIAQFKRTKGLFEGRYRQPTPTRATDNLGNVMSFRNVYYYGGYGNFQGGR